VLVTLTFGYLTALDVPRIEAGLPTPWLGVNERIMMSSWLLWMAALSAKLLFDPRKRRNA
jgi:hypothetical protein